MDGFHPDIKTAIHYFACPQISLRDLGAEFDISKQAAAKRLNKAREFLLTYQAKTQSMPENSTILRLEAENKHLQELVQHLRRQLIVTTTTSTVLTWFKEKVTKFFPKMKLNRFEAYQKKYLLDMCNKFLKAGGSLKDFCKAIGKSHETISRWQKAYEKYGMAGLHDKKTRPRHFARRIPLWLREQLLILFIRHPKWTPYQYFKYMRDNPSINYSISLPTIAKMKEIHTKKSEAEKQRIKKRWAFAENFGVWTVDFTTILKTQRYKLQLLTVSDHRSRFLFETALFLETSTERLVDHLEELFLKYGKPSMIKADNGSEMRLSLRENLMEFCIYLLNSPEYYPRFCGAHERIHRELKAYIDKFSEHRNLTRLTDQIKAFQDDHNHHWTYDGLDNKTPVEIFYSDEQFIPKNVEVIKPYFKEGELRMKFTNRNNQPARMSMPQLDHE